MASDHERPPQVGMQGTEYGVCARRDGSCAGIPTTACEMMGLTFNSELLDITTCVHATPSMYGYDTANATCSFYAHTAVCILAEDCSGPTRAGSVPHLLRFNRNQHPARPACGQEASRVLACSPSSNVGL